jgi:plasmid replication initiation protein
MDLSENKLVKKANTIIEARYKLSLLEQKFVLLMASLVDLQDTEFKFFEIPVKEIAKVLNLSKEGAEETKRGSIYKELKNIVKELSQKPIVIREIDGEVTVNWVASMKLFNNKSNKKGIISFEFSERLKPYLLQLKKEFTSYKLKNIIQLRSSYSIRMYELLKQYEKIGKRTITVNELRYLLGIEEHEYKLYGDFKRKVLLVAYKEIGQRTDIRFDFDEIKEERRVISLRFYISSQKSTPKQEVLVDSEESEYPPIYERLLSWGLSNEFVHKLILLQEKALDKSVTKRIKFGEEISFEDYLRERVSYFEWMKKNKGQQIKDDGAYLRNVIVFDQISDKYRRQKDRPIKVKEAGRQHKFDGDDDLKELERERTRSFAAFKQLSSEEKRLVFEATKEFMPSTRHKSAVVADHEIEAYLEKERVFSYTFFSLMKKYTQFKEAFPHREITQDDLVSLLREKSETTVS